MVKEYRKLSRSFEEVKAENTSLQNNSTESSSVELEDVDSLKTELSRLTAENEMLRSESSELKAEVEKLTKEMSSWTQSARAFQKLQEIQKSALDRTGLGFSNSESSEGETSTQSQPVYDKLNKMGFVKADVIYDCCESIRYDDQKSSKSSHEGKGKDGIGYQRPESPKPS
ncbi:Phytoalexin-deficient 4-2 protein [Dorcoceras hygrometricum]|uniref:Phytoalexin-deficient 4-2 protein n=1 Tax=Dorcoceras hygrometricum TaxID=472368 RepID=A0A2Z7BQX3_9LAMI|nr:Phytoalexin-deficient 4-2 protein [Dorcoceras hygrometricum]